MITSTESPRRRSGANAPARPGFTLVELLIALAVSLLLMMSLTQAFKFISDRIRENRTRVELSTRLRAVTATIQDEIDAITVPLEPHTSLTGAEGYFVYYEGPMTDVTSTMLGNQPGAGELANYFQDSRYGDFDDYLAFTAYNPEQPFYGVVPKYILLERIDETDGDLDGDGDPNDYDVTNLTAEQLLDAIEPVMISSNYAEIIYWVQPVYETAAADNGIGGVGEAYVTTDSTTGQPNIVNAPSSMFPDRLILHRRVLLIRPDLNLQNAAASPSHTLGTLPQLQYPVDSGRYVFMQPDPWPAETGTGLPAIIRTGGQFGDQRSRAWQIGMTPVHQQCDLSVRWALNDDGMPIPAVAANSIQDLTIPHNRFAHVRAPSAVLGVGGGPLTSMPILAVDSQMPWITNPAATSADANGNVATVTAFAPAQNGFLRPEFALGMDLTHTEVPGAFWGRERIGADILSSEVLGFDVQAYDRLAPVVFHPGPDGQPGTANFDDDGVNGTDDPGEYGSPNSDDLVVGSGAPGFFEIARQSASTSVYLAGRGDYVDLAFERLAGGTVRAPTLPLKATLSATTASPAPVAARRQELLDTQFSSYRTSSSNASLVPTGLLKSGKAVLRTNGSVALFQPTYDTFTSHYERDGFLQEDVMPSAYPAHLGTVWHLGPNSGADQGANGIDDNPSVVMGVDDESELETRSPFEAPMSSFRIRIRLQDRESSTIVQRSVVGQGR